MSLDKKQKIKTFHKNALTEIKIIFYSLPVMYPVKLNGNKVNID